MSSYTVDDPDEVMTKRVNDSGQVYIGRKYAGQLMELSAKEVDGRMTKNEFETEYWVYRLLFHTKEPVAVFDDEDEAQEWAEDNHPPLHRTMPYGALELSGSHIFEVKRFGSGDGE